MFKLARLIGSRRTAIRRGFGSTDILSSYRGLRNYARSFDNALRQGVEEAIEEYAFEKTFDTSDAQWEEFYTDILEATINLASQIRTGQKVVIEEYMIPSAINYCKDIKDNFDPEDFIAHVEEELGPEKYDAVDEIIPEVAKDLYDANQQIYGIGQYATAFALGFGVSLGAPGRTLGRGIRGAGASNYRFSRTASIKRYHDFLKTSSRLGNSVFSNMPTPDRVYGSNKTALTVWRSGGISSFAKSSGRTYEQAMSMYGGKEFRQFNLRKNIATLNRRGVYLPSQLTGKERAASLAAIQQTRNQVMFFGKRS